jgi:cold shock CspA family protein
MASMNGTIKRLVSDKGFGFILAGDGFEYFFHNSACQQTAFDDLREGRHLWPFGRISISVAGCIKSDVRPVRRSRALVGFGLTLSTGV